ncbi:class I SAM-dependent methyltransferase [Emcibacter nanhaiensis]|uniref:Class I SAM-dependent methyltransferase n=1 Tax=Emcibacter nanhaiensis TaxID=1505037 RepID=A0A501PAT2_9PROT|nr:methyltransferase domain-containing protein [Emcibacter nanhaiensis]TPD57463.1 class I SAM-dependent methyltransferase [Emcibacter nanhaiensis]
MTTGNKISGVLILSVMAMLLPAFLYAADLKCDVVSCAIENPQRSESDRARDVNRKPEQIISFFGIKPGMTVLDMFAGDGYYTEILSGVVGPEGKVIAHNNQGYIAYTKDALARKLAEPGRMSNVVALNAEVADLDLKEDSLDAIFLILSFHDFYYATEDWPAIDTGMLLGKFYKALKPGGVLAIIDHAAPAGTPSSSGETLHRIDPAIVMQEVTAAGFTFDGETDILRNPDDDGTKPMWEESIRGKTDRFVYRFVK